MAFPDTLSNLRLYVDSKQNGSYVTRVDTDTFIESMPPLGDATLTPEQLTEARQPILENDLIDFRDSTATWFDLPDGSFDLGGITGAETPVFTVSFKVWKAGNNEMILVNQGGGGMFEVGDISSNFILRVRGSTALLSDGTTSLASAVTWGNGVNYVTFRVDVENEVGDIIINGDEFNDLVLNGTASSSTEDIRIGSRGTSIDWTGQMEYLIGAQSFVTLNQLRDLDLFIRDELTTLGTTITDIETGNPVPNAIVKFFEMDAFAADGMDETTAFQNVAFLPGVFKTDENGEVEFSGSIDDTKVQGAMALDNEYDAQWKFTGWLNLGTDNIDKTAPA